MNTSAITSDTEPRVSPSLARAFRMLGWIYAIYIVANFGLYRPITMHGVDYPKHWYAARAILAGESPYISPELWMGFNYPQWSALLTFWIGWLDIDTAEVVWKMIMLCSVLTAWVLAVRFLRPSITGGPEWTLGARESMAEHWPLVAALLIAVYSPAHACSLYVGNLEPINASMAMAFIACVVSNRPRLAGFFWAMLCLFKVLPVMLIVPILLWRQWRILQGWLLTMGAYALLLLVTGRFGFEWFYVREVASRVPFHWRSISFSLHRAILFYLCPVSWHEDPIIYMRAWRLTNLGVQVICLGSLLLLLKRKGTFLEAVELGLLFALLFSPLLENVHMLQVLPVFLLQSRRWIEGKISGLLTIPLAAGWTILCLTHTYTNFLMGRYWYILFMLPLGLAILTATTILQIGLRKEAKL